MDVCVSDISNNLKYYILKNDFCKLNDILYNLQQTINYTENILLYSKKNVFITMDKICRTLRDKFNEELNDMNINGLIDLEQAKKEYDDIYINHSIGNFKMNYNPLFEIKKQILLLCKITSFTNLDDLFYLLFNIENINIIKNSKKHKLLNMIFIPLNYELETISKLSINSLLTMELKKMDNNLLLFDNTCRLKYTIQNNIIYIDGFIKNDNLNIMLKTSQLNNNFLYDKKHLFENLNIDIDNEFLMNYLNNININYLLVMNENEFIETIKDDYKYYIELDKYNIQKLMKIFSTNNNNLYSIYRIIKLLLLGNSKNCYTASLLFNLLKNKTINNNDNTNFISNIIYNYLNFNSQIKLNYTNIVSIDDVSNIKLTMNDFDLKQQIEIANVPDNIKQICNEKLEELNNNNTDTYKVKLFINTLLNFPWNNGNDDSIFKYLYSNIEEAKKFLTNVENKMNSKIYGHKKAKEKMIQILCKIISVQETNINPFALVGSAGVGKTKFAKVLSECLNIPFIQITLGGQNDGELLHGHSYTYVNSKPGIIIKKMSECNSSRCIIYIDELDKCVSRNGQSNELMNILIHLTDPQTNNSFQDRFFQEVTFPLNKVIFIFSFNDINKVDKILLDRMEIINVNNYSIDEKIIIAKNFAIPELLKETGFLQNSIKFDDQSLDYIIDNYTKENGIRKLKICINNILSKLNVDKLFLNGCFNNKIYNENNPLLINIDIVKEILGNPKINIAKIHLKNSVGICNGLYTCETHGGVLPIQICKNFSSKDFEIKKTGNLEKVIDESINYSFNVASNIINDNIIYEFYKNNPKGIHIHVFDGSTPKDGPSAGCAITLCIISYILNVKIKFDVAMTGEIDLFGNISKIGGLVNKLYGAKKFGVKLVLIPNENLDDIYEIINNHKDLFNDNFKYITVNNIYDVMEHSLENYDVVKKYFKYQ